MGENARVAVLVAGMHRSGTSALARLLSLLGCDLPGTLMAAASSNETGHWESVPIVDLNDEILASAGSVWDDWESIDPSWYRSPVAERFRERARSVLCEEFGDSRLFVLKDPRICRLLPFWIEAVEGFGAEPLVVCPVRNPLDVAGSLERRDGIDPSIGLLMWLRHVLDGEHASRGRRRAYLRYEHLLSRSHGVVARLEDALGVFWPRRSTTTGLDIDGFLSPELRHHRSDDSGLIADPRLSHWLRSTFAILDRWSNGEVRETDTADLDRIRSALDEAAPAFATAIASARRSLRDLDTQVGRLNQAVAERGRRLEALERTVERRERRIDYLDRIVAERDRELGELRRALAGREEEIARVLSSNSWKITRPMRDARRWLAHRRVRRPRPLHAAVALGRWVYRRLPIGVRARFALRLLLTRYAPWVLRAANGLPVTTPSLPSPLAAYSRAPSRVAPGDVVLPRSACPVVSIVVPMYGKLDYTLRCLYSIAANSPSVDFEVIVVDDCSPDAPSEALRSVRGLRVLVRPHNGGFIKACNDGAREARGTYLHFLNNDTEVTPGWLDELVRTFTVFPAARLAGSKLVYPDGTLQEAGGIIWRDGSAWNYGRHQDPLLPAYCYARDVDYCSGASLMLPRALFDALGGFDEHYLPAYGEDSDLALKIRERGYQVIYQPLSVVVHHEGVTSGTDLSQGAKRHQILNARKLRERWKERLRHHPAPGVDADDAKDRGAVHRALVLDECTPTPDQDAGSVTALNTMLLLRDLGFQVTFVPVGNHLYLPEYTPLLQRSGIETLHAPYCTSLDPHLVECGHRYDLVLLFRAGVAHRHLDAVRRHCPRARTVFHTCDLHFLRLRREFELDGSIAKRDASSEMKDIELAAIRAADATIVHSAVEFDLVRSEIPEARVHVFPLVLETAGTTSGFGDRRDIVFVGGYRHPPNVDAVVHFVRDVMPLIRERLPGVRFHVVGSNVTRGIRNLACEDVVVAGFIEDLGACLDRMRVFVAPLRYGAGVKGKVGTAMGAGLPVVATPMAAEGMELVAGRHLMIESEPEAFAEAVVGLYRSEEHWRALAGAGLDFARRNWSAESTWGRLNDLLCDIGFERASRGDRPLTLYSADRSFPPTPAGHPPAFDSDCAAGGESDTSDMQCLKPVEVVRNRSQFQHAMSHATFAHLREFERSAIDGWDGDPFELPGRCIPCGKQVAFVVDMGSGGLRTESAAIPNWRERLECPSCLLNNRQRLVASVLLRQLQRFSNAKADIYLMEQVTPFFQWANHGLRGHTIIGSEYLYDTNSGGRVECSAASARSGPVRHEDVMNLSFADESLDIIVSNDVFEHVPDPQSAFAECARTLRPYGGTLLATFPFHPEKDVSFRRALAGADSIEHLAAPVYHGNPLLESGSLVFTDFGWDCLDMLLRAGFDDVSIELYASSMHAHLGDAGIVFVATRSRRQSGFSTEARDDIAGESSCGPVADRTFPRTPAT